MGTNMEQNVDTNELNRRLDKLETTNRRWRTLALICVLAFTGILAGQAIRPGGSMTLDQLTIQDDQGRKRIKLYTRKGDARLELYDKQGRIRIASISAADNRSAIVHYDASGQERIVYGTGSAARQSRASVEHYDSKGNPRLAIYTQGAARSGFDLYDYKHHKRFAAVTQGAEAGVFGYDVVGKLRYNILTDARGDATMTFKDPVGRNRISLGTDIEGDARYYHWGISKKTGEWAPIREFP
jgi:hypothetical protein